VIARCKKDVVNNDKPVLFKTTEYVNFSAAYKAFSCVVAGFGVLSKGKKRGCYLKKNNS